MKPWQSWGIVVLLALATWSAITLHAAIPLGMTLLAMAASQRWKSIWTLALSAVIINGALLAWLQPDWQAGALQGMTAGIRVAAIVGINLAAIERLSLPAWIDGLRLPGPLTAFLAATLLAARDVATDFERMRDAQRLAGAWPDAKLAQWRHTANMVPHLLLAAWRRATVRAEALRLAGHDVGAGFAPIVAVTALGVAGRMALIAVPNVALTYVVIFAGGVLFGGRVGALAGIATMTVTNVMLSGLAPSPFVNVPAMAFVGLAGGLFQRVHSGAVPWAGVAGIVCTMIFSIAADLGTWLFVPELRDSTELLLIRVASGLVFNVPAALANAFLFGLLIGPVQSARTVIASDGQREPQSAPAAPQ